MALTIGRLVKAILAPGGGQQSLGDAIPVGFADFDDATTTGTPISVTGGAGAVVLTNDKAGTNTQVAYLPDGVTTTLWNASTNAFDFSELAIGDMVEIRLDITVTTTAVNQEIDVELFMAIGSGGEFQIPFIVDTQFKAAGVHSVIRYNGFYIGSANVVNYPAQFKISSADNCTVVVHGWYVKVTRR